MKLKLRSPWLIIVIIYFFVFIYNYRAATTVELFITYTFFINVAVSAYSVFADSYPYSLNKIFWIFNLIFLCIIPTFQFQSGNIPWGNNIALPTFLYSNLIIMGCFVIYKAVRYIVRMKMENKTLSVSDKLNQHYVYRLKTSGWVVFIGLCVIMVVTIGIQNLWLRGDLSESVEETDSTLFLLYDQLLRGGILYFVLATIILKRKNMTSGSFLLIVLVSAFLVNFPLSTPRFFTAAFYMSILLVWNIKLFTTRNGFAYTVIAALLLVFPLLGVTRYTADRALFSLQDRGAIFHDSFVVGDFDAYSSFCRTIEYVEKHGATMGKQLLTVFLFFVPREFWPGKSIGSGAYIYGEMRYKFTNISSPFIAEGYINFGLLGSLFFIGLLAVLLTWYDIYYWRIKQHFNTFIINYYVIYYPVLLGLLFFILRGDLLSSFSYTVGLFVAGYLMHNYMKSRILPV